MSGGWKGSDRRKRLPANWPALTVQVKRRSGGKCEVIRDGKRCGRRATGGVDHIVPSGSDDLDNLQDTCWPCHSTKSSAEGNAAKAERRALRTRPADETHPGRTV